MCNLYKLRRPADEIAGLFRARPVAAGVNLQDEVYPGYPGLVVAQGQLRTMTWGFPLARTGRDGRQLKPRPVTNAREDKLQRPFWRDSFVNRRCLIPVSAWAEAEGEPGRMTRTWYARAGEDPFALAGLWRHTAEWGDAFAMVMVDGCPQMADVHDRMPVVLAPSDWETWLGADPDEAFGLCRTCHDELAVDRTAQPWGQARATSQNQQRLL